MLIEYVFMAAGIIFFAISIFGRFSSTDTVIEKPDPKTVKNTDSVPESVKQRQMSEDLYVLADSYKGEIHKKLISIYRGISGLRTDDSDIRRIYSYYLPELFKTFTIYSEIRSRSRGISPNEKIDSQLQKAGQARDNILNEVDEYVQQLIIRQNEKNLTELDINMEVMNHIKSQDESDDFLESGGK